MSLPRNEDTITAEIPNIHRKVDIKDLDANGRLISPENWEAVKHVVNNMNEGKNGRRTKKEINAALKAQGIDVKVNFSVTKQGNQYFAIYKGTKHDKSLGAGAFGSVKLVQNIDNGKWYAFKIMKTPKLSMVKAARKEIEALKKADQLKGMEYRSEKGQFEMVMELGQGVSLFDFANDPERKMPAAKWLDMGISTLQGIADLHAQGLYHRDIKGENLLAAPASATVKPIDLGFAIAHITTDDNQTYANDGQICGTPGFIAPEVGRDGCFSEKTEVYALGATLMDAYGFEDAYENESLWENKYVCHHESRSPTRLFAERIPDNKMRDQLEKFLKKAVDPDPAKRPDMKTFIGQLQHLRNNALDLSAKVSRIAYLDINEFLNASRSQKAELLVALKAASEVQLYASEPHNKTMWSQVKVALEKQGIPVTSSVVLSAPDISMMERLTENTQRRETSSQLIYNAFFVTAKPGDNIPISSPTVQVIQTNGLKSLGRSSYYDKKMNDSLVAPITDQHLEKIEKIMQAQIDRLKQKNQLDPRISSMREFLYEMKENKPTYKYMLDQMSKLEGQMLQQRKQSIGTFIEKKLGIATSTTTKSLRDAVKEVEQEASKPGRKPS